MAPDTDRAFADRAPFALGSALREYGSVSGRRHDVFDKIPMGEAPLVLVGMGPVGDALFSATNELRARGYEVSAVHVSTLRPFPGARLVKALARALAVECGGTQVGMEGDAMASHGRNSAG
jgi:pyruvate-ferredoxin/flavodoxin oxidoreductase